MKLKIGLIGLGHLGKIHLKCLTQLNNIELAGIYDLDAKLTASLAASYNCKAFKSAEALIEEVDAVDIVSPTNTHYHIASESLKRGKHVFVEKPIVSTLEEAQDLSQLQEESGLVVQVGHVERFNPAFLALKGYPLNPLFIEAHRLSEFNPRGTDVPVVLDLMIHDLDIILQLIKSEIVHISASGVCVVSNTPDISNVRIEFANGSVANVTASRMAMNKMRKMRIFQKDAYISMDFLDKKTQIIRLHSPDETGECNGMELITSDGKKCLSIEIPEGPEINAIQEELRSFVSSILYQTPVEVPLSDGIRALELAQRIVDQIEARTTLFMHTEK
jgi:predicted dehydrogenase